MTVNVPGYSSLTGNPDIILEVLRAAKVAEEQPNVPTEGKTKAQVAESILREMAAKKIINIQEETK